MCGTEPIYCNRYSLYHYRYYKSYLKVKTHVATLDVLKLSFIQFIGLVKRSKFDHGP
jgi:hypothetical protein